MIVKSFIADSVAGALKMVRSELGGDAVILKTRGLDPIKQRTTGGRVEVVACIDQAASEPAPPAPTDKGFSRPATKTGMVPAEAIVQKLDFLIDVFQSSVRKNAYPGVIGQLFAALLQADVPEPLARDLAERLSGRFGENDDYSAVAAGATDFLIQQLPKQRENDSFAPGHKILMVGPPGAGKTSLMGRLAGYLVSQKGMAVCLTSLDQVKVSAPEELQTYAEILNVDHFEMPHQVDQSLLDRQGHGKVTLIDMPAMNPRNRESLGLYIEKVRRLKPHRVVGVFSAFYRSNDLVDMIRAFKPFRLTELAFTMTDQTDRLGNMIALSIQTGLPISIVGTGPKAHDIDLKLDYKKVVQNFIHLGEGFTHE